MCHSELSEALEEYRAGIHPTGIYLKCPICDKVYGWYCEDNTGKCCEVDIKPEGIPIELADVIIRILDYCGKENIDIDKAVRIKHEYNKTRPYRHGGKKI